MRRFSWIVLGVLAVGAGLWLGLGGFGRDQGGELEGLSPKEALALANQWAEEAKGVQSYLTAKEIVFVFSDKKTKRVPLPKDEMALAVAPYVRYTHPCEVHFMSSCRGELAEQTFAVKVIDENGNVFWEGKVKTMANGFFELWLPRGKNYRLEVKQGDYIGTVPITTEGNAPTCITNLRLEKRGNDA